MSGVEAAGLALAILPVLLSAANHYNECLSPFLRYKKFTREAKRYCLELDIQRTIFRNQCRFLLENVTDHDAATAMLSLSAHSGWSNRQLDCQLAKQLGDSMKACLAVIDMIKQHLQDIEEENQEFRAIVDEKKQQDTEGSIRDKAWRKGIAKKLSFSFSKSRLDRNVAALRLLNDDFRNLVNQTRGSTQSRTPNSRNIDPGNQKAIEKYQIIGKASRQVYEALGKACTKHTEHLAHFRVEVEQAVVERFAAPQVKFSMAFTHLTLAGASGMGDPIWFIVDSTVGNDVCMPKDDYIACLHALAPPAKREIESSTSPTSKKARKRVRFQSPEPRPTSSTELFSSALTSYEIMRKDFCDQLRQYFRQPLRSNDHVCVLGNTHNCRHLVYPPPPRLFKQSPQATSLGQLISSISKPGVVGNIPIHERLRLAKTLAIAVLQYHATPWLRLSWRSKDILFFGVERDAGSPDSLDLASPHLNVEVKGPNGQDPQTSNLPGHTLARNPLFFSLGVVLLEIAHATSLESLQRPCDLDDGQPTPYAEFFTARRLAKSKRSVMGLKYHNIVEQLVECVFPCGDDLNDPHLQAAFHGEIVTRWSN